ncbi:NAD(P)/FAD-dependent oxidoreductase [Ralstonia solanacearum]|uniref:D-amino-acid oxidase n=1 Tax=Ralstonia solanacearum TaxID=305 RepID=A0AAD0WJ15_RALSL|nr:FAD-binding oxidoreductase [Ralstonia solanacearum]AXV84798.1 D-amino-acid oxidase [Ralstonia solanacearum]AXW55930.1 D-amino-acid oxidase [Ralstonia solanacearum]
MGFQATTIPEDLRLPARVDVVVIGGGIVGISTAMALAEKGVSVAVCEKGVIAGEQSGRNWGWCRTAHRDLRELPLSIESLRMWRTMGPKLGMDTGFRQSGILYVAADAHALAKHERWLSQARALLGNDALKSRMTSAAETASLMPGVSRSAAGGMTGGMYTPADGQAEPERAVPAMALALRARGVRILMPCAVRGIETSAGETSGVMTERGRIRCTSVVIAGGAWTRLFSASLGIEMPQLAVRASVLCTAPVAGGPEVSACYRTVGYRKRLDGGYIVAHASRSVAELTPDSFRLFSQYWPVLKTQLGSMDFALGRRFIDALRQPRSWPLDQPTRFETERMLAPKPVQAHNDIALRDFRALFPKLGPVKIARSWAGYIDVTPDAVPVISAAGKIRGLFISAGYSGHGFGLGPAAGRLTADLVVNDQPIVDPHAFRLGRFSDGSRVELGEGF